MLEERSTRTPIDAFLDLLAPPECMSCGTEVKRALPLCADCQNRCGLAEIVAVGELVVHTLGPYAGALGQAVRRFKYGGRADFGRRLGLRLAGSWNPSTAPAPTVVPVPMHPRRLAERGYDQAAILARYLAGHHRLRMAPRMVRRLDHTVHQASLSRDERLRALVGGFVASHAEGASVVLVDDVVTTGSTLAACRAALVAGGAHVACALAICRTE